MQAFLWHFDVKFQKQSNKWNSNFYQSKVQLKLKVYFNKATIKSGLTRVLWDLKPSIACHINPDDGKLWWNFTYFIWISHFRNSGWICKTIYQRSLKATSWREKLISSLLRKVSLVSPLAIKNEDINITPYLKFKMLNQVDAKTCELVWGARLAKCLRKSIK